MQKLLLVVILCPSETDWARGHCHLCVLPICSPVRPGAQPWLPHRANTSQEGTATPSTAVLSLGHAVSKLDLWGEWLGQCPGALAVTRGAHWPVGWTLTLLSPSRANSQPFLRGCHGKQCPEQTSNDGWWPGDTPTDTPTPAEACGSKSVYDGPEQEEYSTFLIDDPQETYKTLKQVIAGVGALEQEHAQYRRDKFKKTRYGSQ